ncbi:hypothetical protein SFUMM280S_02462 [Streptomyces fumanus]
MRLTTSSESTEYRNVVTVRGTLTGGEEVSVSGTLAGPKHLQKIVAVGEYDVDLALADHMVVLRYEDRPGVVGTVGRILGEAGINIAGMQVARPDGRRGLASCTRRRHGGPRGAGRTRGGDRRDVGSLGQPGLSGRRPGPGPGPPPPPRTGPVLKRRTS